MKTKIRDLTTFGEKLELCERTGFNPRWLANLVRTATVDITVETLELAMREIVADPQYAVIDREARR